MCSVPALYRWSLIAMVLALPMVGELVVVFRPDMFYGWVFALGLVWMVTHPIAAARLTTLLKMGGWLGATLLVKPSVYPQTCLLFVGAMTLRVLLDVTLTERRAPISTIIRNCLVIIAIGSAIALPHYWYALATINDYIKETIFGSRKEFWARSMSLRESLLYYVTGLGQHQMLGERLVIVTALLCSFSAAILFGRRTTRSARLEWIGVVLVMLATYALPTLNQTKTPYLGVGFLSLTIVAVMYTANLLFRQAKSRHQPAPLPLRIACVLAAVISVTFFSWPSVKGSRASAVVAQHNQTVADLYALIQKYAGRANEPHIMITAAGPRINPDQFMYQAMKQDNRVVRVEPNLFTHDPAEQLAAMQRNDFLIAPEPGTGETSDNIQPPEQQQHMLDTLRGLPEFRECASVNTIGDGHYVFFVRRGRLLDGLLEPFIGFTALSGLAPIEGPWPQYKLPVVRPGLLPRTVLRFDSVDGQPIVVLLDAMSAVPGQTLTMTLNGATLVELPLETDWRFHMIEKRLTPIVGSNSLELIYAAGESNADSPKAVFFKSIRIISATQYDAR
jgi:hypothetical protein